MRLPHFLTILLLTLVPLALFWQVVHLDFAWDDRIYHLHGNPHLEEITPSNLVYFWTNSYTGMYIPVTYTLWGIIKCISGEANGFSAFHYHLCNLFLHIANGLLLYFLLKSLTSNHRGSLLGSLLFLLHPIQIESVAWVSELRGLLSCFLSFSALGLYLLYRKQEQRLYFFLATISFLLATLAKPNVVVLPIIVGIIDHTLLRSKNKTWALWLPISLLIIVITKILQPDSKIEFLCPLFLRPLITLDALNFYFLKLFFPFDLCALYGRSPQFVMEQWYLFWVWIPGTVLLYILHKRKNASPVFYSKLLITGAIFLVSFLPVSGLIPFAFQSYSTVADRYLYLGMLGPALLLAFYPPQKNLGIIIWVLILSLWGWQSRSQISFWKNDITLWENVLRKYPKQAVAHNNLGSAFSSDNKKELAMEHYFLAIECDPSYADSYNNLGNAFCKKKLYEQAENYFAQAVKLNPESAIIRYNYGNFLSDIGQVNAAITHYTFALKKNPRNPMILNNLGYTYEKQGKQTEALAFYKKALQEKSSLAIVHYNIATLFRKQNKIAEAQHHYYKAIEFSPKYFQAYNNLANIARKQGQNNKAIELYKQALQIRPKQALLHLNLAAIFYQIKKTKKAIEHYQKTLEIDPKNKTAQQNLEQIYREQEKNE